jgi:DNA-binding XRE family transcriptional regulator
MDVKNPYVRLRELCGTSQKGFAAKHGFGKMTMVYLESGM